MKCPAILANEQSRLQALYDHGLNSEGLVKSLDPVVQIAARMFDMPVAAVNMIGSDHVFFAAVTGTGEVDMRRDVSFCAHAINQVDVMVVPDATQDERFHDNPLVTGEAQLRFYAGVRLLSPDGLALGALCVIDSQPHFDFSADDQRRLQELAQMVSDRLELKRIETQANRARPDFASYAGHSSTPVVWFNDHGQITAWNTAAAQSHGYGLAEGIGQPVEMLLVERDRATFRDMIERAVVAGSLDDLDVSFEARGLRKGGGEFQLSFSLFGWKADGEMRFEVILKDITAQRLAAPETDLQNTVDPLTGLANRARYYRVVEDAMIVNIAITVLMIDLDSFKDINDTLGHACGDQILKEIAHRLRQMVSAAGVVARIGGDEFAIVLLDVASPEYALALAEQAIHLIAQPIVIYEDEVRVIASCGVALAPTHAQETLELVSNADLALFKAKATGRGRACVFSPVLRLEAVARRLYAMELYRAVNEGEFLLYYQPQVNLTTGRLTGAEALIRWRHPKRGILAPISFLPALENGTLAATVGAWVLDEACAQVAYWRRHTGAQLRIGVNLFGAQFKTGDLYTEVVSTLTRHGLPPTALELEVTENIALDGDEVVLNLLRRLKEYGVGIAFDDFGTGYASLSLLKTYPLTRIKIDRSFVQGMLEQKKDDSVVCATLDITHAFDLQAIAEGIETHPQYEYLRAKGCEEGQGELFGKPMPAEQFAQLIALNQYSFAA